MASPAAVSLQLHPSTGVTQCVSAYLTHPRGAGYGPAAAALPNLVVARSTWLEVYSVRQPPAGQAPDGGEGEGEGEGESRLELVSRRRLHGVVESMAALPARAGRRGGDGLLLTFRDAKLSVLRWDPEAHELTPSSLHYFEGDESLKGGRAAFARPPLVAADPAGRCAAVVMFRQQLGVLPAMEADEAGAALGVEDLYGSGGGGGEGGAGGACAAATVGNSYVDNLSKMNIRDVRDAAFLHGYNEPVLLVLHEGDPTWAGHLRAKKDTCALSALSLNLSAKRHPRIWHAQGLPSDAYRLMPAPSGGTLVLCLNMVLYYSQGAHAGVVVHSAGLPAPAPPPLAFDMRREAPGESAARYARAHASYLHPEAAPSAAAFCDASPARAGWDLECDAAHAAWVGPSTALLGLRGGALLLVRLERQGGGGVAVRVARAGAGPPASCMAALSPGVVFVGSFAGDSLLVGCQLAAAAAAAAAAGRADEPGAKRRRLESADADRARAAAAQPDGAAQAGHPGAATAAAQEAASDEEEEEEEALLYAAGATAGGAADLGCSLRVLDSLVGIGPVRSLAASPGGGGGGGGGGEGPFLLACCGHERAGALAVLRQRVCPEVLTEVPLPGVTAAWAVRHVSAAAAAAASSAATHHSYLLLSFPGSTKVLATGGADLREVTDEVEFAVDTTTIAAGSVCGGRRLLQAFPQGLRLLDGGEQRQEVWAAALAGGDQGAALAAVHVADPFVVAQLEGGSVAVMEADGGSLELRIDPGAGAALTAGAGPAAACCLYRDECGWLGRQLPSEGAAGGEAAAPSTGVYCVVAHTDGSLSVWALPHRAGAPPAWRCAALPSAPRVLVPTATGVAHVASAPGDLPSIVELRVESFGAPRAARPDLGATAGSTPACEAPVLVALTSEHTLLAYKAFACGGAAQAGGRSVRFARLPLAAPPLLPPAPGGAAAGAAAAPRLVRFDGVGEELPHSGLFVGGASPQWLVASRGGLVPHPAALPQGTAAAGFTPFHNANCPHGFIVACSGARAGLQISQLPPRQRLDAPWPRHKIAIRATPLRACLYAEAGLFALLTARLAPARPFLPEEPGSEPQAAYAYALAGAAAQARPSAELHELRLLSPGGWGTVWRYALLPGEAALAVEAVRLRDATTGDTVPLLAVGTGFSAGEDYPCSGRVLLFEVRRPAGGAGGGWGGELVFAREFKGPVTALCSLEGHLLLSTGNRLETCTLSSATAVDTSAPAGGVASATTYKLARSAFYDGPSLVTSLSVVKSFVLLGDAQHSVQFVRYREDGRQLGLLGKDFGAAPVAAAEFLIAGSSLHLVAADGGGTLRAFTYTPADPGSWKGQKLLNWGALHVGDRAGAMLRARMPPPRPDDAAARQAVVYGTDAGGVGVLAPLALAAPLEPRGGGDAAAALRAVAAALGAGVAHGAGLNPGAFRRRYARVPPALGGGTPYGKQPALGAQGILDGDLLLEFGALPVGAQAAAAARAGVTRAQVLAALSDIARCSVMF